MLENKRGILDVKKVISNWFKFTANIWLSRVWKITATPTATTPAATAAKRCILV